MESIRQYLLSIIAAAVVGSLINSIIDKKSAYGSIVRMIAGILLSITVIRPITQIQLTDLTLNIRNIEPSVETYISTGTDAAKNATASIIKSRTESYILEKAAGMGLDLKIDVTLDDQMPPKPIFVKIIGQASPYSKQKLQNYIAEIFAIPKENQEWTSTV